MPSLPMGSTESSEHTRVSDSPRRKSCMEHRVCVLRAMGGGAKGPKKTGLDTCAS